VAVIVVITFVFGLFGSEVSARAAHVIQVHNSSNKKITMANDFF
jgi:hypothetical protein